MKNAFVVLCISIFFYVLQTSLFPASFFVLARMLGFTFLSGHTFNLVFLVLVYLALHRDLSGTLIWSIFLGVISHWFGLGWNGAQATSFFMVGLLCNMLRNNVFFKDETSLIIFTAGAVFLEGVIHLGLGQYFNQIPNSFAGMPVFLFIQIVLNALISPIIFWFLRWIDSVTGVTDPRTRRSLLVHF